MSPVNYLTDEESLITAMSPANLSLLQEAGVGPLTCNIDEGGGFTQTRPGLGARTSSSTAVPSCSSARAWAYRGWTGWSSR